MNTLNFPARSLVSGSARVAGSALASALALACVLSMSPASALAADEAPQIRQAGNIAYVSGGVSEEDRMALEPIARDFNLKLIFALRNGEYLSDTAVVVTSARGQPVLDAKADGPWFFARLPSGQYTVTATANGQSQRKTVSVGGRGRKTLDFRWSGPEDGPRRG